MCVCVQLWTRLIGPALLYLHACTKRRNACRPSSSLINLVGAVFGCLAPRLHSSLVLEIYLCTSTTGAETGSHLSPHCARTNQYIFALAAWCRIYGVPLKCITIAPQSPDADVLMAPSGEKATAVTQWLWPSNICSHESQLSSGSGSKDREAEHGASYGGESSSGSRQG